MNTGSYSRNTRGRIYCYSYRCVASQKLPDACTSKNLMESELLAVVSGTVHRHMDTIAALEQHVKRNMRPNQVRSGAPLTARSPR